MCHSIRIRENLHESGIPGVDRSVCQTVICVELCFGKCVAGEALLREVPEVPVSSSAVPDTMSSISRAVFKGPERSGYVQVCEAPGKAHEGFALWSLHIEDGMSSLLEDVPIVNFKRPVAPSDDNAPGVRTRWSADQQALLDEQVFRYDAVAARVYSWLKRQIILTDVDAKHVAKHFQP